MSEFNEILDVPGIDLGTISDKMYFLSEWVLANVKRVAWSNDKIEKCYGRRSVEQILYEGETCYMGPCPDLTAVAIAAMNKYGLNPEIAVEKLEEPGFDFPRFHFASEFMHDGQRYFLDFNTGKTVVFGKGDYSNIKKNVSRIGLWKFDGSILKPDTKLSSLLTGEMGFRESDFTKIIERMKRGNTSQTFEEYQKRMSLCPFSFLAVDYSKSNA